MISHQQPTSNNQTNATSKTKCARKVAHIHGRHLANRVSTYYSIAIRFLYHSIPFTFYGYGYAAIYTVTAAILLIIS